MAVYKRGKTYWIRFQSDGQEVRKSARTTSRSVAVDYEKKLRDDLKRIYRNGAGRYTYDDAMTRFIEEYLPHSLKPNSQKRYIVSGRVLHPHFSGLYLDEINKQRFSEFKAARLRDGVETSSIKRDVACLSSMMTAAVSWDWIDTNPIIGISKKDLRDARKRTRYLTFQEYEDLLKVAAPHLVPLIQFAVETGMRFGEQFTMVWDQVNLSRKEVVLTRTKTDLPRTIPLTSLAYKIITSTPRHINSDYVFWHDNGQRYTTVKKSWATALKKAKIEDFRWHDLRHTFASWATQSDMPIETIQKLLGHKTISMTTRYAHLRSEDLHRAMKKSAQKTEQGKRTKSRETR